MILKTKGKYFYKKLVALIALTISLITVEKAAATEKWHLNIYGATVTAKGIDKALTETSGYDFSFNFLALAFARTITSFNDYLEIEMEGQFAQHFGGQEHVEINALLVTRWLIFPWDKHIDTSFAIGEGLSLATETPKIERRKHDDASQFLNYLLFELAFSLPDYPSWAVITRLHHRSGVFGLFDDVTGASNALGVGLKYSF